jgi:hypothetical protein
MGLQQPLAQKLGGQFAAQFGVECRCVEIIVNAEKYILMPIGFRPGRSGGESWRKGKHTPQHSGENKYSGVPEHAFTLWGGHFGS